MAAANPNSTEADVVDVVCGEVFPPSMAVFHSDADGKTFHFCSSTCKATFDQTPQEYVGISRHLQQ